MRLPAKRPLRRKFVVAIALIAHVLAGLAVHVAPAHAAEPAQPPLKQPLQIRETPAQKSLKPCHESTAAQGVDQAAKPASPVVKTDKACCKDGSCKCPVSTPPAAIESRAATAPAACPTPRADGICEAPPSRLRPSVFFRPPI